MIHEFTNGKFNISEKILSIFKKKKCIHVVKFKIYAGIFEFFICDSVIQINVIMSC